MADSAGTDGKSAFHYRGRHFGFDSGGTGKMFYGRRVRVIPVTTVKIRPDYDITHIDGAGKPAYKSPSCYSTETFRKVNKYADLDSAFAKQFQFPFYVYYVAGIRVSVKKPAGAYAEGYGDALVGAGGDTLEQGLMPPVHPVKHPYSYSASLRPRFAFH
jgi:hypothetical protein